jgi:hypothetical protein
MAEAVTSIAGGWRVPVSSGLGNGTVPYEKPQRNRMLLYKYFFVYVILYKYYIWMNLLV